MLKDKPPSQISKNDSGIDGFIEQLKAQGLIQDEIYEKILLSHNQKIIQDMVRLSLEIEVIFWPMAGGLLYLSSIEEARRFLGNNFTLEMAVFSFLASSIRLSTAYFRGRAHKLGNISTFALLETIPKVGRFAPLLWLPEHEEYLSIVYAQKRVKKIEGSEIIDREEFAHFQNQFKNILDRLGLIQKYIIRIQSRVGNIF